MTLKCQTTFNYTSIIYETMRCAISLLSSIRTSELQRVFSVCSFSSTSLITMGFEIQSPYLSGACSALLTFWVEELVFDSTLQVPVYCSLQPDLQFSYWLKEKSTSQVLI